MLSYLESQAQEWNGCPNGDKHWDNFAISSEKPSTRENDAGMEKLPKFFQIEENSEIILLSHLESQAQEKVMLEWNGYPNGEKHWDNFAIYLESQA